MAELMMGLMLLLIIITGVEYLTFVVARWRRGCCHDE